MTTDIREMLMKIILTLMNYTGLNSGSPTLLKQFQTDQLKSLVQEMKAAPRILSEALITHQSNKDNEYVVVIRMNKKIENRIFHLSWHQKRQSFQMNIFNSTQSENKNRPIITTWHSDIDNSSAFLLDQLFISSSILLDI